MANILTPYDTGKRAEPMPWKARPLGETAPIERELEADRYGKVDFDDNESSTLVTIWVERDDHGRHVVHIVQFADDVAVMVHG